jgi:hypothetical protein
MPQFLLDNFTGSSGSLTGHTSDSGSAWQAVVGAGAPSIDGSGHAHANASIQLAFATVDPATNDYTATVTGVSIDNGYGLVGVFGRYSESIWGSTWYRAVLDWTGALTLVKQVSSSGGAPVTGLGSASVAAPSSNIGTPYVIDLVMAGTSIKVKVNGTELISVTDSEVTTGKVGLFCQYNNANYGFLADSISGTSAGTALVSGTAAVSTIGLTTSTVTMSVAASGGTAPYTYQWQRKTGSGGTYANVGSPGATLNDTGLTRGTLYYYRCVQTDSASETVTSNEISLTTCTSQIVVLGNSQSLPGSWPDLMKPYLPSYWSILNQSVGGKTTTAMITDVTTNTIPYLVAGNTQNLVIVQEVMNDIYYGATGASAYANLVTLSNLVRNVNDSKLVVLLPQPGRGLMGTSTLPGGDDAAKQAEYRSRVQDFLTLFFANWRSICDSYLYFNDDPRFGDINNGAMFTDTVHWGTPLQQAVAYGAAYATPLAYHPGQNRVLMVG